MLENAKALVVVLALALATFHVCKPIALQFMREETFQRRRNVWLALTVVGFLSPSFWIWAVFALGLLFWAGQKDANPLSVFCLMTFTVPQVSFSIPAPLVNQLFELTPYRILSLAVLIPAVVRERAGRSGRPAFMLIDAVLLAFIVLQIALLVPYETITHTMRRTLLLGLDVFLVLYAFSRVATPERLADVMACFWLAIVVMAPIALFESLRGWLLYTGVPEVWGVPNTLAWLLRADELRAQAAANHSINFGYHVAMALTVYLYLRVHGGASKLVDAAVLTVLSAAIIVSYSRGAWVTAVAGVLAFVVLRPDAAKHVGGTLAVGAVATIVLLVTPLKEKVVDRLPFIGTEEQGTIEYRQQLSETSWALVNQNPLFGDPFVVLRMESLRQGQGMIDIVNGYLYTALFNGYVGLACLCGIFALAIMAGFQARRHAADARSRSMAAALSACMLATLVYIATAGHSTTTYVLCGLLVSAAGCVAMRRSARQAEPGWRAADARSA